MWGSIHNQLRSVIQWTNPSPEAVVEQWSHNGDEIKNASKLIVGPGQGCVFVYQGKIEAIFMQEGIYELRTANIPFWTTVSRVMQAFQSEFKVGIYFFKTTQLVNMKWGTPSVVKYEDPKYKFPVGLRAFGNFSIQIKNIDFFFRTIIGAQEVYTASELRELFVSRIIQPMTDVFAESKLSYAEIDSHRNELSVTLSQALNADFDKLGFQLVDFRIEGTSFDEDTMKRINRIADMSAESQAAAAAGVNYAQLQQLQALRDAAKNPGGAGMVMGMGVGMGLGQQVGGLASQPVMEEPAVRLKKLTDLFQQNLISKEEFEAKKQEILSKI
jgi:membrane protease subunit (stomatin/prohibitin family)